MYVRNLAEIWQCMLRNYLYLWLSLSCNVYIITCLPMQHAAPCTHTFLTHFKDWLLLGLARGSRPVLTPSTSLWTRTAKAGSSTTMQTDGLYSGVTLFPLFSWGQWPSQASQWLEVSNYADTIIVTLWTLHYIHPKVNRQPFIQIIHYKVGPQWSHIWKLLCSINCIIS